MKSNKFIPSYRAYGKMNSSSKSAKGKDEPKVERDSNQLKELANIVA